VVTAVCVSVCPSPHSHIPTLLPAHLDVT